MNNIRQIWKYHKVWFLKYVLSKPSSQTNHSRISDNGIIYVAMSVTSIYRQTVETHFCGGHSKQVQYLEVSLGVVLEIHSWATRVKYLNVWLDNPMAPTGTPLGRVPGLKYLNVWLGPNAFLLACRCSRNLNVLMSSQEPFWASTDIWLSFNIWTNLIAIHF